MNLRFAFWLILLSVVALLPTRSPAPLIYLPGEGWYYESTAESAKWIRPRAKEQLQVAEEAFTNKNYKITLHASHRILRMWPMSDYSPRAAYLIARCLEADGKDEAAFDAYQKIMEKYPSSGQYNEVLQRQQVIATRFLNGQWFKLWNLFPLNPSMDDTVKLYEKIISNGPYSEVAPQAQINIGIAHERKLFSKDYPAAVKAYELAADRYHNLPAISAEAMYRAAAAWEKQAAKAEYDQGAAGQAIAAYTDFITIHPDDGRVEAANKAIVKLKAEQVRGSFEIAKFYDKRQKWAGAVVYYSDVLQKDANSPYAEQARQRLEALKPLVSTHPAK